MKDLKIKYINKNGNVVDQEYDTIMDFLDHMDSHDIDLPMMDYADVEADFFENPNLHRNFATLEGLYNHCKAIVR